MSSFGKKVAVLCGQTAVLLVVIFYLQVPVAEAATFSISGTLYSDQGTTPVGAGKVIKVSVGTSTPSVHTTTTGAGGVWTVSGIDDTEVLSDTSFVIWLDGNVKKATTISAGYQGVSITNIPLYYDTTVVYTASSGSSVDPNLAALNNQDSARDPDILFTDDVGNMFINSAFFIKQGVVYPSGQITLRNDFRNEATFDTSGGSILYLNKPSDVTSSYISGTDGSGTTTGTGALGAGTVLKVGNYTYIGKDGDATACSQTPGSAIGCELMVFDVSDPVNPVYVAGRDASGDTSGTASGTINSLAVSGNFLYVGLNASTTACAQTAGSAIGCEIQVYDISSSTNPVYVAGRDSSGSAAGTGGASVLSLSAYQGFLYAGKTGDATACSQTAGSAVGCEFISFDIASTTNPVYRAGQDTSGNATGTTTLSVFSVLAENNAVYITKAGNATACTQVAGTATGCELMVFTASGTNPIFAAGRDVSASTNGTGNEAINTSLVKSGYLYIGKIGNATACSQTAGSAIGCEIQVYNIVSSSTNPVYAVGRDASGNAAGTGNVSVLNFASENEFVYVSKAGNATACSQTAGSAVGCELLVFNVSSSTNPTYQLGRDVGGDATGTQNLAARFVFVSGGYIYLTKAGSATACSQTAGAGAAACELAILESLNSSTLTLDGNLVGSSSIGNVSASGSVQFLANASSTSVSIEVSARVNFPSVMTITDLYANSGTGVFDTDSGRLFMDGDLPGDLSGNLTGASALPYLIVSGLGGKLFSASASTTGIEVLPGGMLDFGLIDDYSIKRSFVNNGTINTNTSFFYLGDTPGNIVIGRDVSGSATGTQNLAVQDVLVSGNHMYVATAANGTACSQVAGLAIGCELQVYDISSSTNPIFRAGRDSSGSATGNQSLAIQDLAIQGNFLFVAKAGSGTACSNTAGSAVGCELMVFDISSTTNPIYVVGRDISGNAAGTGNLTALAVTVSSSSLFLMKTGNATACSQTAGSAIGCELMVFDIASNTNPVYVAGRDADTSLAGTQTSSYNAGVVANSHLYVTKAGSATACSQTAGSAIGCELQVYNVSSTTNPVYVAGRDVSGNAAGTQNLAIQEIVNSGNSIFVSKPGSATACSQTAGSAVGCEFMVFDIASTTNPIYRAGRDVSGSNTGTGNLAVQELAIKDHFLYAVKPGSTTACSQTAGSAIGCELMVFDIASTTNPIYSYGRDVTGNATGTGSLSINTLSAGTESIVLGVTGDGTACATGIGIGCELMVLQLPSPVRVSGNFTGPNAFNSNVTLFQSGAEFLSPTQFASDLININSASVVRSQLIIDGAYDNRATIAHDFNSEVVMNNSGNIIGNLSGSSSFYTLKIEQPTFVQSLVASTTNLYISSTGELTAPGGLTVKGNFSNQGVFDETGGVLYLENDVVGEILSYVAGRDSSGSAGGATNGPVYSFATKNNMLYVGGSSLSSSACSQTAGSAEPCELKVYDISSSTNPVYIAGRDVSGSAGGTGSARINALLIVGEYLFFGKTGSGLGCSQVAGSAIGCELQIYNISSTTNPVYVAGRDVSGSAAGGDAGDVTSLTTVGNYLYVGKGGISAACSQVAGFAAGCELMVFDISSSTNPVYVAGRDASGSAAGAVDGFFFSIEAVNNNLYVAQDESAIACSQVAGSAAGCELMVFDISSSTNPVYVAGRDGDSSSSGTSTQSLEALSVKDNYLYVGTGNDNDSEACSPANPRNCELQIYDISSSTNPVYVAGLDSSGSMTGTTTSGLVTSMHRDNNLLYVGKIEYSSAPCSQIAGSAAGCELMVFDISSSTNPVYVAGRDNDGSAIGSGEFGAVHAIAIQNNTLYVGKDGYLSGSCSQVAGSAGTCELAVFSNPFPAGFISGSLTATSSLGDVELQGAISFLSAASTSDFIVQDGNVAVYRDLSVSGNFSNSGGTIAYETNPTVYLAGGTPQTISGALNASSSFSNLAILSTATTTFSSPFAVTNHFSIPTPNAKVVFAAGATSTVGSTTITGTVGNNVQISSTNSGQQAGFTVLGNYDIEYVTVKDSYASTSEGGIYALGTDGGNTTNWFLSAFGINITDTAPTTPVTLFPGAPATTTSRFTLATDIATSTDIISIGISLLTPNATSGIELVEITNAAGTVVYGSTVNPTSTPVNIVLDDTTLTINNTPTNYLVRVTPKSHAAQPAPYGAEYPVSTRVNSITSNGLPLNNTTFGAVVTIDNLSPGSSFLLTEDFETGDLTGFTTSGDANWSAVTDSVSSGVYSAKSGDIADDQVSNLSYVVAVASGTEMYFDRRVSSEETYDLLQLYVNEVLREEWSGEVAWSTVGPYLLSEGEQTIRFTYSKDGSETLGADTAWIDNLRFVRGVAPATPTATTTGADVTISYTTPTDADYNSTLVLYSTSPLVDAPSEGTTYVANDTIGAATVGCVDAAGVSAASSTCVISGLTPATTYYFSAFYKDDAGNYSLANDLAAFLVELADAIFSLSGVLYGENRVTPIATPQTITVATPADGVFGTSSVSTTGLFNFSFEAGITPGQPVTIYVDGNPALRAATVVKVATSTSISNIPLYQNHVVLKSQQGTTTPFTNASFSLYDSSDDTDVQFTYAGGTNAVATGYQQDLYVASGVNYVPQGDVSVGGSFTATTSTTVNFATSTLTLTSTSTEIIAGVNQFGNLVFTGNGGAYSLASANASTTNITIGSGATFTAPTALTVNGNFNNQGVFNENSGTLYMENLTGEVLKYLAGRDVSGNSMGTSSARLDAFARQGNYLYVGASGTTDPCSQTAGSAQGCELQVYDISSSTNPVYIAGRDNDGSISGVGGGTILSLVIKGNYLYVGLADSGLTACSQVAGSAAGCELLVFNISSSTNPVYVAGRDSDGSASGNIQGQLSSLAIVGNYLYAGVSGTTDPCSQTAGSAQGCELQVYDISSSTNPVYVAGRDSDGSASGIYGGYADLIARENFLYVLQLGEITPCSQTAGSAEGCELQVYDISSSTNPIYVAGRDSDGSASGITGQSAISATIHNNYLYLGLTNRFGGVSCSQVAGSAEGCELQVYDISSSTNPIYVAGRDGSGSSSGSVGIEVTVMTINDNYLYLGLDTDSTPCSQVAGSAEGCELQVYDISSSTNPFYVAGRDVSGSASGTDIGEMVSFMLHNNVLYAGSVSTFDTCSQVAGSAGSCELLLFNTSISGLLLGNLVGTSTLGDVVLTGQVAFRDSATTSAISVLSGTTSFPLAMTVKGDYQNNAAGLFDSNAYLYLDASTAQSVAGNLVGVSKLSNTAIIGSGVTTILDTASTTNLTVQTGATLAVDTLEVQGGFMNAGEFTAGPTMNLKGNYTNTGSFNNNSGLVTTKTALSQLLAARRISGLGDGFSDIIINSMALSGDYLFLAGSGNSAPCTQIVSSSSGCEIKVFDISSSTNPVYVAGRDASGNSTGTSTDEVRTIEVDGQYLYLTKGQNSIINCSSVAGFADGCDIQVYDISNPANPVFVAGRDISGSNNGSSAGIGDLEIHNGFMYVVAQSSGSAPCSQVAGSAEDCEIQVYDISSSTNPIYRAGRDISGSASGETYGIVYSLLAEGNTLYVGINGDIGGACSQTAGFAEYCELQVYDISSSTNPIYRAGRDADGSSNGTVPDYFSALAIADNYLYVGKFGVDDPCSQTVGSSSGCELQVYDISSSTNPMYVGGRDIDGSANGESSAEVLSLHIENEHLYVGSVSFSGTACSQAVGFAESCELQVYDISSRANPTFETGYDASGTLTGDFSGEVRDIAVKDGFLYAGKNVVFSDSSCFDSVDAAAECDLLIFSQTTHFSGELTGANAFNDLSIGGAGANFFNSAEAENFTIASGEVIAPVGTLTVNGNYNNQSIFNANSGTVDLAGSGQLIGNLTTNGTFNTLQVSGNYSVDGALASTTNLTIASTGNFTAPSDLTVYGNYNNLGVFDSNNGTLYLENSIEQILGFIAARDVSGNSTGTANVSINAYAVNGNYLYVSTTGNATACSQVAGSAQGCELKVFDISSSTNPVYVAGRDASGNSTGTELVSLFTITKSGNYLYVGTNGGATACSQVAGAAQGCELQIYDISSSTNPVYVAGRDASGNSAGTGSLGFTAITINGNYLYVGTIQSSTACSQTAGSAIGCELKVFDISSPTNPVYVAGRDSSGDSTGTGNAAIFEIIQIENYAYVLGAGNATACSQTAGSALGCELKVFDISSPTNPVYVAGRDASGNSTGTGNKSLSTYTINGDYLYIGTGSNVTACSQTAGSALGCELMVFEISSSTNPVYVAGRDASGDSTGTGNVPINALDVNGNYLYAGTSQSSTTCSQTAGSAIGCELKVFDISSSTNPVYVAGRDASGNSTGIGNSSIFTFTKSGNYLYIGTNQSTTTCSQVPGSATGCEIQVFSLAPALSGIMTATSSFNNLNTRGAAVTFLDNASTTNLTIESDVVTAPSVLSIGDTFINNSGFNANGGEVVLLGNNHTITGTTTFFDLTKVAIAAATTTFEAGSLTTIGGEWNFTGVSASERHALRSSSNGDSWFISSASSTISNLDVKDSNNVNVEAIVCDTGCLDSFNNVNWVFEAAPILTFTSPTPHQFYVGQATTTLPTFTLVEGLTPTIATTTDLLLHIDTAVTNLRFDQSVETLSFGGTAAGKVSAGVFYSDGHTVIIDVLENFSALDTLTIDGLAVGSFATVSTTTGYFTIHTDGDTVGAPAATDLQPVRITGLLNLQNHTEGQVDNEFSFQNQTDTPVFAFNLTGTGETITLGDLSLTLSGIQGIDGSNISDFKLYKDTDNDLLLDGGDLLIDGNGILTINGQNGAVTFSTDFIASTTANYFITADINSIQLGDSVVFSLPPLGIGALGATSVFTPVILSTVDRIQHMRNGGGGGGIGAAIGGAAPGGDGDQGGGETGGGGGAGEEEDGDNIAPDPDFARPTATGEGFNEWTNGGNALLSDGTYATAASTNLRQSYNGFPFNIPGSNTITGIAVKLDASGTTAAGTIDVSLSWDGGNSYTTAKATPTFTGSDIVYLVGGNTDLWGHSWTASQFDPSLFRLRVSAQPAANTIRLDALEVRVYHQAGGGGAGGGGGI